jgi:uncharacterized membrane protein
LLSNPQIHAMASYSLVQPVCVLAAVIVPAYLVIAVHDHVAILFLFVLRKVLLMCEDCLSVLCVCVWNVLDRYLCAFGLLIVISLPEKGPV